MSAVLFGSLGTIADTSELQREAFNQAFRIHGLHWHWDRDEYRARSAVGSGQHRIAGYARSIGQRVDVESVDRTKAEIFRSSLAETVLTPRPGVVETIRGARTNGFKVGIVTTTSPEDVSSLISALGPRINLRDFDVVVYATNVYRPKPGRAAYDFALRRLGERPGDCIAIENSVGGVRAATAAGLPCVALRTESAAGPDFGAVLPFLLNRKLWIDSLGAGSSIDAARS